MFRFVTTRFVLLKEPQSVLAKMFEIDSTMEPAAKLKDGSYFIDRDPERFKQILNYLRDDELGDLTRAELNNLKIDARYFMLENLLGIINERLDNSQNILEGKIDKIINAQRRLETILKYSIVESIEESQRNLVKEIKRANFFENTDRYSSDGLKREEFVREIKNLSKISKSVEKSLTEVIDAESALRQILKK